jgi:hypothetical protein
MLYARTDGGPVLTTIMEGSARACVPRSVPPWVERQPGWWSPAAAAPLVHRAVATVWADGQVL